MIFDAGTGFLFVAALNLFTSIALWAVLLRQRTLALDLWCGAGLVLTLAFLLLALRPVLPTMLGYTLASLLAITAAMLRLHAIRLELGEPEPIRRTILTLLAFLVLYEWLRAGDSEQLRFYILMSVLILISARIAWWAWRLGRTQGRRSAYWIAGVHVGMAAIHGVRMVNVALGNFSPRLMTQGYDSLMLAMILLIAAIVVNIAWLGLALERLIQEQVAAAAAQARSEENRVLGERIAHLERQHSLGLLSASLGHELQQPLTAVLTNAQVVRRMLGSGRIDSAQMLDYLDKIVYNTERAGGIIERIRRFLRPGESRRQVVDLVWVAQEVAELVAAEARGRRVPLRLGLPSQPLRVIGDPLQLSQVVLNLLRNALDASGDCHREVAVRVRQLKGQAVVEVEDHGPGLTHEAQRLAGQPFFTTKSEGLGLGLSISRAIAEQHGGVLRLSNAPDGGALAELRLPLAAPQSAQG
jgi:signal transduction histidine kinase